MDFPNYAGAMAFSLLKMPRQQRSSNIASKFYNNRFCVLLVGLYPICRVASDAQVLTDGEMFRIVRREILKRRKEATDLLFNVKFQAPLSWSPLFVSCSRAGKTPDVP
jgi:hypothetical protein